jgi:hypothetical protein
MHPLTPYHFVRLTRWFFIPVVKSTPIHMPPTVV